MELFTSDGDLLAYEPGVFVDLPLATQRTLRIEDGVLEGATLRSASGGLGVLGAGDVVVIAEARGTGEAVSAAVESVADEHALRLTAPPAGLAAAEGLSVEGRTLRPQARLVHAELLRAIGMDPDDPAQGRGGEEDAVGGGPPGGGTILTTGLMRDLEALGTLSRAYTAGAALVGDNEGVRAKAAEYRHRFAWSLHGARVLIDLDGDGLAEEWRTPGVGRMVRA